MQRKDPNLHYLEEIVASLQLKENTKKSLEDMKRIINRVCAPNECVEIMVNEHSRNFFIMNVYPAKIYDIAEDLVKVKETDKDLFKKYKFIIEIDSKLLYDKSYNFTPNEIVAILAHELGHVQNIDLNYKQIKDIYMSALSKELLNDKSKEVFDMYSNRNANIEIAKLFILDQLEKISVSNLLLKTSTETEKVADTFVHHCGYTEELLETIKKIKKYYSKAIFTKSDSVTDAINYIKIVMISNSRQSYIMRLLKDEKNINDKIYVNKILDGVIKNLDKSKYGNQRRITTHLDDILQENFLKDFLFNPIKISQKDIDELLIEFEMVETYNQKMALMYKIHRRLLQVEDSKMSCANDNQKLNIIKSYQKQLTELLGKLMKKKIVDKQYGVFVKYPKGYEG